MSNILTPQNIASLYVNLRHCLYIDKNPLTKWLTESILCSEMSRLCTYVHRGASAILVSFECVVIAKISQCQRKCRQSKEVKTCMN